MRRAAPVAVLALAVACAGPAAAETAAQRRCVNGLNAAGVRVAAAAAKRVVGCVGRGLAGSLPAGRSAQACLAADDDGRIARATARTTAVAARCRAVPDVGAASGVDVNAAVLDNPWAADLFGDDLDAALAAGAARCQRKVTRAVARVALARLTTFAACVRRGLRRRTVTDGVGVGACYGSGGARVARATRRLTRTLARACAGVDAGAAFPGPCAGAPPDGFAACLAARLDCRACRTARASNRAVLSCHRFVDGVATAYCGAPAAEAPSVARQWDEEVLGAIRIDVPRPPVHARNLFHVAVAMWDAWAAYDPTADGYLTHEKVGAADPARDRAIAIAFAAYRVAAARYAGSANAATSAAAFAARMEALGLDAAYASTAGDGPAAVGNRIAAAVLAHGLADGANEAANYADPTYVPVNEPLVVKLPGTTMLDPNRWQPLALDVQIGQNGVPIPGTIQVFVGPQWGAVVPFAASLAALLPGPPPRLHDPGTDAAFKAAAVDVLRRASELTPDDGVLLDVSPGAYGNNPLGTNAGTGHALNPATGQPYAPQPVRRGDFARVLAEYWADGPASETPPGHWNSIANYAADGIAARRVGGSGPVVDDLEWDVKLYFALNGALHDAAVACWGTKRHYDSVRPISMVRHLGGLGQSSDPSGPSHHPDGLPLVPGLVEVVTPASSAPGERHAHLAAFVGEIAVYAWPGEPTVPSAEYSGVRWVRARTWVPYQRKTFVTPPFAGYPSGHSTYSRAAAEVLTRFTGSAFFPHGLGEFPVPQDDFLQFEIGPSAPLVLQWATYYDAADQAGQSRIWGGIHVEADDFAGRVMGATIGTDAWTRALGHFDGSAVP